MNEEALEKIIDSYLEDNSFEDFLEEFDLTPLEVLVVLFRDGMIDERELERFQPVG
jgi:hypothetical protein